MSSEIAPIVRHEPESCPICGPVVRTEAFKRGTEAALLTIPRTVVETLALDNPGP